MITAILHQWIILSLRGLVPQLNSCLQSILWTPCSLSLCQESATWERCERWYLWHVIEKSYFFANYWWCYMSLQKRLTTQQSLLPLFCKQDYSLNIGLISKLTVVWLEKHWQNWFGCYNRASYPREEIEAGEQGCGSATRFRDCRTKNKIKKNFFSPGHVAARRSRRYKTRPNTEFVFCRLHEM